MSRCVFRSLMWALAVALAGATIVEASAPGGKSSTKTKSTKVVTETETEASLAGGSTQAAAKGYAESEVVTVTDTTTSTSTTNSKLTISVKGLTLADGDVVTFNLNGTAIGTGTVASGRAKLRLTTKNGDTVPTVNAGDTIDVIDPDGSTVDLTGAFGAPETETESSGH